MNKFILSLVITIFMATSYAAEPCPNISGTYQAPGFMAVKIEQSGCQSFLYSAYNATSIDDRGTITGIVNISLNPFTIEVQGTPNALIWNPPNPTFIHAQRNVQCTTGLISFSLDSIKNLVINQPYTCIDGFNGEEISSYYRLNL